MSDSKTLLTWERGQLWWEKEGEEGPRKAIALYARPISAWGEGISILDQKDKSEIIWVKTSDDLNKNNKKAVLAALEVRYGFFEIVKILASEMNFGNCIVKVETRQGPRVMNVVSAWKNVLFQKDGSVIIRDAVGNRYRIPVPSAMDPISQNLFRQTF